MAPHTGLADLPPAIFSAIIDQISTTSNRPLLGRRLDDYEGQFLRRQTLGSLSVVSEGVRKLAQPLIFDQASVLCIPVMHSTDRLARLFNARPESTAWPKSLSLHVDHHPAHGASVLATLITLISRFISLESLEVSGTQAGQVLFGAPAHLFSGITSLHIHAPFSTDPSHFYAILSRCPNLTSLQCAFFDDSKGIEIAKETVPLLSRLTARMEVARLLVGGRPVNDLTVAPSGNLRSPAAYSLADLKPLAMGSTPIRRLNVSAVQWSNGCLQEIAAMFPSVEKLILRVESSYDGWLERHLAEIVPLLPDLRSIKVIAREGNGPPPEEVLDEQLEVLKEARKAQDRLEEVAFLEDVTWVADDTGFWTAVYHEMVRRTMYLTPKPDTRVAKTCDSRIRPNHMVVSMAINNDGGLSSLPVELQLRIIALLKQVTGPDTRGPDSYYGTLKALCLTSRTWCLLAQPYLFQKISLTGCIREALFVSKKLAKIFNAREGSALWVQRLRMHWFRPSASEFSPSQDMGEHPVVIEMGQMVSRLLSIMHNLRTVSFERVKLPYEVYTQLYQLRRLKTVIADDVTFVHSPEVEEWDTSVLTITDLTISRQLRIGGMDPPLDSYVGRLARSPTLRKLDLWKLSPQMKEDILGPNVTDGTLRNLEELKVSESESPFDTLITLAPYSPNLRVLSLGMSCYEHFPDTPDPIISLPPILSPTIWPALAEFRGWIGIAQLLVPGRPITKITVLGGAATDMQWDRQSLVPLARGSAPVKELILESLAWRQEAVEEISALFPQLEVLKILCIASGQQDWLVHNLLHVSRSLPHLRVIGTFLGSQRASQKLPKERDILPRLQEAKMLCPHLTEVIFRTDLRWIFKSGNGQVDPDGTWTQRRRS